MALSDNEVAEIVELDAPVLCLDTCSILDLIRAATNENANPIEFVASLALLEKMEGGRSLKALLAQQVYEELGDNLLNVQKEAETALDKWKLRLDKMDSIMETFGATAKANIAHWDGHVGRATLLANRMASATIRTQAPSDVAQKVFNRVGRAITPAKKGKESMKDCIVIETYLASIANLRNKGLTAKVVFVSSNIRDYAGESGVKLKPDLAAEFAALSMEYAPNMGAAKFMLGL
jgi:prepilin-type processing-associated H-X9-DG protein